PHPEPVPRARGRSRAVDEATIERITAYAALSDPAEDLAEAARWATEGDVDWQAWLADWRLGLVLILRLDVVVAIARPGAEDQRLTCSGRSVWVEKHADPPTVQEQLRHVAASHLGT